MTMLIALVVVADLLITLLANRWRWWRAWTPAAWELRGAQRGYVVCAFGTRPMEPRFEVGHEFLMRIGWMVVRMVVVTWSMEIHSGAQCWDAVDRRHVDAGWHMNVAPSRVHRDDRPIPLS